MQPARAAQDLAHLARLHLRERAGEELGQAVGRAPAHLPALQRVSRVGVARREAREVGAGERLGARLAGAPAHLLDSLRARLVRQPQQDVRQIVFGALRAADLVVREVQVDLGFADLDALVDLALAQALQHDLLAHLLAETLERDPVALERLAELREGEPVALGDAFDRAVELQLVHADAAVARELQLRALQDQALEHLPLEHRRGRNRGALAGELAPGEPHALAQLARRHHLLVDHGDDAVDERNRLRGRGRRQGNQKHRERETPHAGFRQNTCGKGSGRCTPGGTSGASAGFVTA